MIGTRESCKSIQTFNLPKTKSKNVTCVHCEHRFFIRGELLNLRGQQQVPLLLKCGHSICYRCTKINYSKPCPLCKVLSQNGETSSELYPLNIYVLGLIVIGCNQPINREEPDINFYHTMPTKLKHIQTRGMCYECEVEATFRCPQCNALFCRACYSKIHGKALQKHTKIKLNEVTKDLSLKIGSTCSDTCQELPGYYCQDCQICSCSHCMLRLHSKHNHITLEERNQEMMQNFFEVYDKVGEALQRIQHMHKKVKTMRTSSAEMHDFDSVEAKVTQHFAHLHGVLQNIEKAMIDKIYERRGTFKKNLDNLETRLNLEQDRLQATLLMAAKAKDNFEKIDINEVVCKLKEIADVPCHLVQEPILNDDKIVFAIDENIIDTLEKHCELKMPAISEFNLLRTELLPDNYQVESLQREIAIPTGTNSNSNKNSSVTQEEDSSTIEIFPSLNKKYSQLGPVALVKVMNVYDPSMFYVQLWSNQKQIEELSTDLQESSRTAPRPTQEITVGKMYMVEYTREKVWRRGKVTKVNSQGDGENTYNILYVDSGYLARNVPISSFRVISPKHASVPILAIKCALHNVVSSGPHWSKLAIDEFRKLAQMYTPLSMHVFYTSGNTHYVDLRLCSDDKQENMTSMRETLVFMEHAKYVSQHQLSRTNPLSIHKYFQEELELETFFDMAVQCVVSPDCIYVTKTGENQKYVNKLMRQMTAFYDKNVSCYTLTCPLEIGTPCAFLHVDRMWYRGLITKIIDEDSIEVFCVDFGYCFNVNYESLRRLTINYISSRCQAIRISLKDLKPFPNDQNEWSSRTIEFTTKYLTNQKVRVIAMNKKDDTYSVYLYIHGKINFNSFLASKNLANIIGSTISVAKTKKRFSNRKKDIKNNDSLAYNMKDIEKALTKQMAEPDPFKIQVQIHKALSPDYIYVSDLSREEESIQLITKMQDFYTKYHSKEKISWAIDSVCAVYSSKDKRYFRGRILKFISDQEVLVLFYDVALEEIISIKNIQPLHISFQQEPAYVFKVKLAGILPCGDSGTWPSSSCQKLVDIIAESHNCQFYITKVNDSDCDNTEIPVQLWIKQSRTDEPLSPTIIEINSVNKMLVEAGLALPIRGYKAMDKTLAIEFKRQLQEMQEMQVTISTGEEDIKWFSTAKEILESPNISFEEKTTDSVSDINDSIALPENLTDWLPALPISNDNFIATPTNLDYDAVLYLHTKKTGKNMLEYIEKMLTDFYDEVNIKPCDEEWTEGDMCIAQYHGNKKWYRGKVTKILDDDKIEVQFVDYGNKEECAIGTLKKRIILGHIPIQCTECLIHGLHPDNEEGKWNIEDLDKIHLLLVEKDCKVTVLQRQDTRLIVSITLLKPKKCDLISYLVNELGIRLAPISSNLNNSKILNDTCPENISMNSSDMIINNFTMEDTSISQANIESEMILENVANTDHVISGSSMLMRNLEDNCEDDAIESLNNTEIITKEAVYSTPEVMSLENLTTYVPLIIPKNVNSFEVELCYSEKPTVHCAQLGQNIESKILYNYYVQYHALMKDIQKCAPQQPLIKIIAPNTPCCAKFINNVWYRTIIQAVDVVENTNEVRVQLYYVDFGNSEDRQVVLEKSGLHTLKEEWLIIPTMLITCHLWRVSIPENVDFLELLEELEEMYETCKKITIVKIKERYKTHLEVELYTDKTCKKLLYQSLIERGFLQIKQTKED